MTTATSTANPTAPSRIARLRAAATAEARLLLRNRTAVFNSVLMPLLLVAAVPALGIGGGEVGVGPTMLTAAVVISLVYLTYYNLVTTYVARREDLVLQRMRTGELSDGEVLTATAVPTLLVTVGQLLLVTAGVVALGEWTAPVQPLLVVGAVLGGLVLMVLLAIASTGFTRTAESAQITTLPIVLVSSALSGLFFPLSVLPEGLANIARFLPVTPVVDLLHLGFSGTTWEGDPVGDVSVWTWAAFPAGLLVAWIVVAALLARRGFRWAPRR
ncbi:ABC-2 type transport system permease protein [Klenkia marina]|uniref:ABC-2 type transport system permease protein n=2 Tax=Klenkia marina TaxID=1960309 RepID=A0A1G4XV92_9ACTN|nr:ABC-2 type transport system permease protein [Klenkia marina]